jgi:hypothetical protein
MCNAEPRALQYCTLALNSDGFTIFSSPMTMFEDPLLAVINTILIVGIVSALVVAPWIRRGTQALHRKNIADQHRMFGHDHED